MSTDRRTFTQLLEVHLEELGEHSWVKALLNTVGGTNGSAQYRFVARPPAGDHRAHDHVAISGTFPMLRWADPDDVTEPNGWSDDARKRLVDLERALLEDGWVRLAERGDHWWSLRFSREGPPSVA